MTSQDNPHFTAYALGELSAEEARAMHDTLASLPSAAHELEQIEAITDALRHGAPIPQARLTHEQRHSVLHPASLPRRIQPMMPRKRVPRPHSTFWPIMTTLFKAAAVITMTGAAFMAGRSLSPAVSSAVQIVSTPAKEIKRPETVAKPTPVPTPALVVAVKAADVEPVKQVNAKPVLLVKTEPVQEIKVEPVKKELVAHAPLTVPNLGFSAAKGRADFVTTTKQPSDQFNLRTSLIKPVLPKPQGQAFASPLSPNAKPEVKPARASELFIHSWKAEVASCPWNAANRLLRIVIQVPADQAAVLVADVGFPLQITFDQANVKQFRMLCERHQAATELRSAGAHVLWYEFQPNGSAENIRDGARQVASVTLPNTRFTSQTVGPFDSSKLQIIDRGYSLQNAREDFVFESSVVGFGLLLRGAEQVGGLNHDLVLNLANQSKGADVNGERGRFIRLVQAAQRVAGL